MFFLKVLTPEFEPLGTIPREAILELDCARTKNDVGVMTFSMRCVDVPPTWFRRDTVVELWRKPDIAPNSKFTLFCNGVYFLRVVRISENDACECEIEFELNDQISLLDRKVIAWYGVDDVTAGDANVAHQGPDRPIDDIMKSFVRYNMGDWVCDEDNDPELPYVAPGTQGGGPIPPAVDGSLPGNYFDCTDRDWSAYIAFQRMVSDGPGGSVNGEWQILLDSLQQAASTAENQGEVVCFDFVYSPGADTPLEFSTWAGLRGVNRIILNDGVNDVVQNGVAISPDNGSLTEWRLTIDWTEACDLAFAIGGEFGGFPVIAQGAPEEPVAYGPFYPTECLADGNGNTDETTLRNIADAATAGYLGKYILRGDYQEQFGSVFGVNFNYGDRVSIAVGDIVGSAVVTQVRFQWDQGDCEEVISFPLEASIPITDVTGAQLPVGYRGCA